MENNSNMLKIVLIGQRGAGKTTVMKTILGISKDIDMDNTGPSSTVPLNSNTTECELHRGKVGKQMVIILDTPGLSNPEKSDEEVMEKIQKGLALVAPGPDVFLYVHRNTGFDKDEDEDEADAMKIFKKTFTEQVMKHTMVLITCSDTEDLIKNDNVLSDFVEECQGRYYKMNIVQETDHVCGLMEKVNKLVKNNNRKVFSLKEAKLRREVGLVIGGSTLAGAAVGGATSHFVSGVLGVTVGVLGGATLGGVIAAGGILAYKHIKSGERK